MREFWAMGPGSIYNSPIGAAKDDDREMIIDPRLSILGFGVHHEFYEACQAEDIDNGFLNRISLLDEPAMPRIRTDFEVADFPFSLMDNLCKLSSIKPRKLGWTPAAREIYEAEIERIYNETDERKRKLWSRTPEKIVRAASAFAASRFAKTVEREDMELAQVFMRQSDYVFQIGIKEAEKKRILDHAEIKLEIIRRLKSEFRCEVTDEHGKPVVDEQGNPLVVYEASEAELRRTFRHNTTRRDAFPNAVGDLCDSGTLRREHRKTGGRDKYVLRLMEE